MAHGASTMMAPEAMQMHEQQQELIKQQQQHLLALEAQVAAQEMAQQQMAFNSSRRDPADIWTF